MSNLARSPTGATRKRNFTAYAHDGAPTTPRSSEIEVIDLTGDSPTKVSPQKRSKCNAGVPVPVPEKRARIFRKWAPQSYLNVKERALTQRLTVLSRQRCGSRDMPEEKVTIAGSTGNVYTVSINLIPSCNCPHARKGNQCKHIVYVMLRVLKAPEDIAYQLALISSELRQVIWNAPPIPGARTNGKKGAKQDGNRKPIEGECPICYDELDDKERTVYCKSSCGNNIHMVCMQKWIAAARSNATCPYCRAKWEVNTGLEGKIDTKGLQRNEEGYVNVAAQLGLSGHRDYSTYGSRWVRRHLGDSQRRSEGW